MTARQLATPASDGEREFRTAVGGLGQRSSGAVGKVAPCRIRRDGRRKVFALGQPRFRAGWLVERRGESGGARVRRLTRHRQPVRELHLQVLGLHRGAAGGQGRRRISKKRRKKRPSFSNVPCRGYRWGMPADSGAGCGATWGACSPVCGADLDRRGPFPPRASRRRIGTPRLIPMLFLHGRKQRTTSTVGRATDALGPTSLPRARGLSASS